MNKFFNPDNKLFSFIGVVGDHMILSVLWVVTGLPILTIGAATAALCEVSADIVEQQDYRLFKDFFRGFARHFWRATGLWLVLLAVGAVLTVDVWFYLSLSAQSESASHVMVGFFLVLILLYVMCLLWAFPCLLQFRQGIWRGLVCSLAMAVRKLGCTLLMLAAAICLLAGSLFATFLLPFVPGLIALSCSLVCRRVFRKAAEE